MAQILWNELFRGPIHATVWVNVAAGTGGHSLGLKSDSSMWAWGLNNKDQLGDGTAT